MARLPQPGSDDGTWGDILNGYLSQSHNADGSLKAGSVGAAQVADSALPATKLDASAQASLSAVAGKYTKPGTGIPKTDLDTATQASLTKADTSLQAASNLSDLSTPATARTNLGLGTAATMTPATLAVDSAFSGVYAPLASPALTGVPSAPTAAADTNTTQLATTAYVVGQGAATSPAMNGVAAAGSSLKWSRADHVHPTDTTRATRTRTEHQYLAMPTGYIAETFSRLGVSFSSVSALVSGQEFFVGIPLFAGQVVSTITFRSGGTAASVPTHQWFTIRNQAGTLLGITSDDLTTAWGAIAAKTLTLATPYTVPSDGIYLLGCMVAATTVPSLRGVVSGAGEERLVPPILGATDTVHTGLTTPATAPATATYSVAANYVWALVA